MKKCMEALTATMESLTLEYQQKIPGLHEILEHDFRCLAKDYMQNYAHYWQYMDQEGRLQLDPEIFFRYSILYPGGLCGDEEITELRRMIIRHDYGYELLGKILVEETNAMINHYVISSYLIQYLEFLYVLKYEY